jgi:hypothetical protein
MHPPLKKGEGLVIGEVSSMDPDLDKSYKRGRPMPHVDWNNLACVTLNFCLTRCDTNQSTYDICMIPRKLGGPENSKEGMLRIVMFMFERVTKANFDIPLLAMAHDWHGSHILIIKSMFGFVTTEEKKDMPFLKHCNFKAFPFIDAFRYKLCVYKDTYPVYDSGDGAHLGKHWPNNSVRSGNRCAQVADVRCGIIGGILGGWAGTDFTTQVSKSFQFI